MIASYIII